MPASRHRTAHSNRLRYWSNLTIFPIHSVPDELVITTTFGTSHGPTQPLIVSWTRFSSPRFRHSLFNHSTGTSGKPRSVLPQQQPRQIVICTTTTRLVLRGQSLYVSSMLYQFPRTRSHSSVQETVQIVHPKRLRLPKQERRNTDAEDS